MRAGKCSNTAWDSHLVLPVEVWFLRSHVSAVHVADERRWQRGALRRSGAQPPGRVDQVDVEGLRRLAASIDKHFGDDERGAGAEAGLAAGAASLEVVDSRSIGAVWLLDGLWRRLDVAAAVRAAADARRFTTNMERVLFALVANRAVAPFKPASDAHLLDTTHLDIDAAIRAAIDIVEATRTGRGPA